MARFCIVDLVETQPLAVAGHAGLTRLSSTAPTMPVARRSP